MDAMILAAGLGTRLRPLTDDLPKALIEVGGRTLLERVAERLVEAGADRLVINVHHHAERVVRFVRQWDAGVEVRICREEPEVLETGGGLLHAREHFREDAPFFLHNVDVLSTADLGAMYAVHQGWGPLATLAVGSRDATRPLLFDERGLYGRQRADGGLERARDPSGRMRELGFNGIHVVDPRIFELMGPERGRFSIISVYMRLAALGERIAPWDMGKTVWMDVGTPERLVRARARFKAAP